jgi:hypothetical protein
MRRMKLQSVEPFFVGCISKASSLRRLSRDSRKGVFYSRLKKVPGTIDCHDVFRFEGQWPETPATLLAKARGGFQETPGDPAYHCEAAVVAANGRAYRQEFRSWHFERP